MNQAIPPVDPERRARSTVQEGETPFPMVVGCFGWVVGCVVPAFLMGLAGVFAIAGLWVPAAISAVLAVIVYVVPRVLVNVYGDMGG